MNNQLTIIGRVGQDPKAVSFADTGNKVVKFSLGVTEYSSKKDEEKTLWIDVDCWNGLGDRVMQTITKGREVLSFCQMLCLTISGGLLFLLDSVNEIDSCNHVCKQFRHVKSAPTLLSTAC